MKKLIIITAFLASGLGLVSCKKDFTCTCTTNLGGPTDTTIVFPFMDATKKEAVDACDSEEAVLKTADATSTCGLN